MQNFFFQTIDKNFPTFADDLKSHLANALKYLMTTAPGLKEILRSDSDFIIRLLKFFSSPPPHYFSDYNCTRPATNSSIALPKLSDSLENYRSVQRKTKNVAELSSLWNLTVDSAKSSLRLPHS